MMYGLPRSIVLVLKVTVGKYLGDQRIGTMFALREVRSWGNQTELIDGRNPRIKELRM